MDRWRTPRYGINTCHMNFDEMIDMLSEMVHFQLVVRELTAVPGYIISGHTAPDGSFECERFYRME